MRKVIPFIFAVFCGPVHADFNSCMRQVEGDSKYAPLSTRLATGGTKTQTFEMVANNTYATSEDKPLISSWVAARNECYTSNSYELSRLPLPVQSLAQRSKTQFEAAAAELYNGKVTYGGFAMKRADIAAEYTTGFNTAKERHDRDQQVEMRARQDQEDQRSRSVLQYLANQPRPVPYQIQHPQMPTTLQTNCTTFGGQTNCTTR